MELQSQPKHSKFQQFELQATSQLKIKAKNLNWNPKKTKNGELKLKLLLWITKTETKITKPQSWFLIDTTFRLPQPVFCSRPSSALAIEDARHLNGLPRWVTVAFNGRLKEEREAEIEGKVKRHGRLRLRWRRRRAKEGLGVLGIERRERVWGKMKGEGFFWVNHVPSTCLVLLFFLWFSFFLAQ